ncbi:hypothetical protein [Neptuniibacter sp. 2_MG-2023]|uniref:hypothetical protein n=1 Tax=Neptuniibacter sp. 2_MG-2023 TaxID=3062671 RepID=UPI0026E3F225|nr:hypothetical protein [Neptuniibacter sp. 2_MG-2023]
MEESLTTKILRILSVFIGLFMFGISAFICFVEGNCDLWVGLVLGPIFLLYGALGKSKFAKKFPGASRNV